MQDKRTPRFSVAGYQRGHAMTDESTAAEELRGKAEEKIASLTSESDSTSSEVDIRRLLHELQVHQVELEMQNEELQRIVTEKNDHETHLRNIISQTPAGYFHIDLEGRILDVNNAWLRIHGYDSKDEVIGRHFSMMQVDSKSDSALVHLDELKKGVPIPYGEFASRRKDGTVGHHIFSAHPVVRTDDIVGFEWFIIDISERKLIDEVQSFLLQISSLRSSENFFELLAKYLADTLKMEYVCIDRLQNDCLSARTLAVYHDGTFDDNVEYTLKDTPCGDVVGKQICVFPREVRNLFPKDAALRDLQAESYVGTTLWSLDMKPIGLIAVIGRKHLTNSHFAESVLKLVAIRAAAELERKQAEEAKMVMEHQLHHSQKMEAIGQLAGGVAHDFNNKLMVILGKAQLAMMDIYDSTKMYGYLHEIRRAAEHSRDITYRLLAFSRQGVISPEMLDANRIIADSLKSLSRLIGEHVSITFDPDDKLWGVRMDPVQLDQIVMNLAINARDAMPDGGTFAIETRNITLDNVSCRTILDAVPGDYVRITFSDTGTGMDKVTLEHIFEPFFTTKAVGQGTGLGLATVYGIIGQNNCFIKVTSKPGAGTDFTVYFPRCDSSQKEGPKLEETLPESGGSILLVEDEDAVRSVTAQFLHKIGYTVHEAATPHAAIELVRDLSIRIDLIITDFVMPEMNGLVMMERIRGIRPTIKYIVASGYSTGHALLHDMSHSGITFIQKPYDFAKLREHVKFAIHSEEAT